MLVVDTGVLFAVADRLDAHHEACVELLATHPGPLKVPVPVIVETAWLISDRVGPTAEALFLDSVLAGELQAVDLDAGDWQRARDLIVTYADMNLGLVDAAVIAIAERLEVTEIATINPRDFRVVRPAHCEAFTLLP